MSEVTERKPAGRPREYENRVPLTVHVPLALRIRVECEAKGEKMSVSKYVREALESKLAEVGAPTVGLGGGVGGG